VLSAAVMSRCVPRQAAAAEPHYTELVAAIGAGRVASLEIGAGDVVRGRYVGSTALPPGARLRHRVPAGLAEHLIQRAEAAGVAVTFERARNTELYRNGS
jgi:hypothetical protein